VKLFVDTNILVRCSRGLAFAHIVKAISNGVELSTTSRNAEEFAGVLQGVFGFDEREAMIEVGRILQPFEIVEQEDLLDYEPAAESRLHEGGKSDWPSLAAAIAMDCGIWSDDRDYFGVGVPVWSTANIKFAEGKNNEGV
jgi:predicted nucleic acid-binding protein